MLSRADAEALALRTQRRWRGIVDSYWVTTEGAAEILGVNLSRVRDLAARGPIPAERNVDGTWMFRREQLMTVAHARRARWA